MFLKILQINKKTPVPESLFLLKLQALDTQLYWKKRLWHSCFPLNFARFLRTFSFLGWLLLGNSTEYEWTQRHSSYIFTIQGRRNGFENGGAMKHWKVLSATMVCRKEKLLNSRRSRMAKTVTFWPWKLVLKLLQYSQENTCVGVSL